MLASETQLIARAILADVLGVRLGQALNGSIDGLHAAFLPHALSREIGVGTSTCKGSEGKGCRFCKPSKEA